MIWIAIRLQCGNQSGYPWSEDDQVPGAHARAVGVRRACGHKYRGAWVDGFGSIGVTEGEFAFEYMPSLVVGMVNMQGCGATAPPFVDAERIAGSGERFWLHRQILTRLRRPDEGSAEFGFGRMANHSCAADAAS